MKLHQFSTTEKNIFTGYGPGYVEVNQKRYNKNMITMPDHIIEDWQVQTFDQLSEEHFKILLPLGLEILLLGTGATLRFPSPLITKELIEIKTGVEIMDTNAACRTYNILMDEGRNVAAALFI